MYRAMYSMSLSRITRREIYTAETKFNSKHTTGVRKKNKTKIINRLFLIIQRVVLHCFFISHFSILRKKIRNKETATAWFFFFIKKKTNKRKLEKKERLQTVIIYK